MTWVTRFGWAAFVAAAGFESDVAFVAVVPDEPSAVDGAALVELAPAVVPWSAAKVAVTVTVGIGVF